jgi:hypothetical protein
MADDLMESVFARAYKDAEARKAEAQAREDRKNAEAEALMAAEHIYDPMPYPEAEPHDSAMYRDTGIGALYGLPNCERFLPELGDWVLAPRTTS